MNKRKNMSKKKTELSLDSRQAAELLRALADSLEKGEQFVEGYDIDLSSYEKIKVSLRSFQDSMFVKVKVKKPEASEELEEEEMEAARNKEDYKKLKKRMKTYFKELQDSLDKGQFPSREIVSVFLRDSETMLTFTGKGRGEEHYEEYRAACRDFQQAFESEDMGAIRNSFRQLDELQERCHSKYK
jgi:XXXCH domain-containing protein